MSLRMERQVANCNRIASYLAAHPLVKRVNYAGLTSHPGHALHFKQATSAGSILSFETGERLLAQSAEIVRRACHPLWCIRWL